MTIAVERADAAGVRALLEASDEFHAALYPPEGTFLLDVSELLDPAVTVVVARVDGVAVGMGALVVRDGYAEIKRMFVRDDARGGGLASGILSLLEATAADLGVAELRLETGPAQPTAIAFYERKGFTPIPLFGDYVGSVHSLCFAKRLTVVE